MLMDLLHQVNKEKHGYLLQHLDNEYSFGGDNYPTSITATYNFIFEWNSTPASVPTKPPHSYGVTLTTKTTNGPENSRKYRSHINCFGRN